MSAGVVGKIAEALTALLKEMRDGERMDIEIDATGVTATFHVRLRDRTFGTVMMLDRALPSRPYFAAVLDYEIGRKLDSLTETLKSR